MNFIE